MEPDDGSYTAVAIVLHWAIAAAILTNLLLGWWMHGAIDDPATKARAIVAFQLHKSLGLTVLVLTVLRLLWRLTHRPPPLPAAMPAWEKFAARFTHWAFYALMVVVPLSGWSYVSAQWAHDKPLNDPTLWFGLFRVPHLFQAGLMPLDERKAVAARNLAAHFWLACSMGGLLVLHVTAALKHHLYDRDAVLVRMLPALAGSLPVERGRRAVLRAAAALIFIALAAVAATVLRGPSPAAIAVARGTPTSAAGSWEVEPASTIGFSFNHAGYDFHGRFTRWQADIRVDPQDPGASSITATVDTASAVDGAPLHEETLPQAEWFDVARYPSSVFRSTKITAGDGGRYRLEGTLQIKDRALPVSGLSLTVENGVLHITGTFDISRKDANLGMESDAGGEFVSMRVGVDVNVTAVPP
jgi:cytochrome b561